MCWVSTTPLLVTFPATANRSLLRSAAHRAVTRVPEFSPRPAFCSPSDTPHPPPRTRHSASVGPPCSHCTLVRVRVIAPRHDAQYQPPRRQILRPHLRHAGAIGRRMPRSHHGDRRPAPQPHLAPQPQHGRWIINLSQPLRIRCAPEGHYSSVLRCNPDPLNLGCCAGLAIEDELCRLNRKPQPLELGQRQLEDPDWCVEPFQCIKDSLRPQPRRERKGKLRKPPGIEIRSARRSSIVRVRAHRCLPSMVVAHTSVLCSQTRIELRGDGSDPITKSY